MERFSRALLALGGKDIDREFAYVVDDLRESLVAIDPQRVDGVDIGVRTAPSRIVGGDYVDFVSPPGTQPLIAVGDVSGASFPAALRAWTMKYVIRALVDALGVDPLRLLESTARTMGQLVEPDQYISAILCTFTSDLRTLRFANGGHDPPLILRAGTKIIDTFAPSGLVFGIDRDFTYVEQRGSVDAGDTVVLYTDGFVEARNPEGDQFTQAELERGLREHAELQAQALADALFARVEAHAAGTLRDDASIVVVRVIGRTAT